MALKHNCAAKTAAKDINDGERWSVDEPTEHSE